MEYLHWKELNNPTFKDNLIKRFESKVEKTLTCHLWIATHSGRKGNDYGMIDYDGKMINAHRISYLIYKGDFPKNLEICHSCDNTLCVNPDHLWVGTHKENMQDMKNKKRTNTQYCEKHPMTKINNDLARLLFIEIKKAKNVIDIAKKYNINPRILERLKNRQTWRKLELPKICDCCLKEVKDLKKITINNRRINTNMEICKKCYEGSPSI